MENKPANTICMRCMCHKPCVEGEAFCEDHLTTVNMWIKPTNEGIAKDE